MSNLADQLKAMLRRYAASEKSKPWTRFRIVLRSLIAEHGINAVEAPLTEIHMAVKSISARLIGPAAGSWRRGPSRLR
jgi:hypothetical protein